MVPLLIILYFLIRLPNLTLLPIFTDETNYLDWGWREIHAPSHLWYSLYDAKPPLVMWLFGLSQSLISDPLLAGRLVSVLFGLATLLGLYFLGRKYFSLPTTLLSCLLYLTSPLFHLYDRQALMESALSAVFIWLIYFTNQPVVSGLLLGIGLLIKPTALLFFAPFLVIRGLLLLKSPNFGRSFLFILLSFLFSLIVVLPMLAQPIWQKTSSLTGQYLHFPSPAFLTNIGTTADILFWQLTPFVTLAVAVGLYRLRRTHWHLAVWVFLPLFLQILTGKFLIHRYLAPFLAPLLLFAAAVLRRPLIIAVTVLIPLALVLLQTLNPPAYFHLLSRLTPNSYIGGYVTAEPSGYNFLQARKYFLDLSQKEPFTLGVGLFSGNPEAAFIVYFRDHPRITVSYLDAQLFNFDITQYDCLTYPHPLYLATRDKNTAGLAKFMDPVTVITNSYNDSKIYVSRLKSSCQGKSLDLGLTVTQIFK